MSASKPIEFDETYPLPEVIWPTRDEARRLFDELARAKVGMSGDEFLRRLDAGEFADIPDDLAHRDYISLALMSGFGR